MTYEQIIKFRSDKPIEVELLLSLARTLENKGIHLESFDKDWYAIQEAQRLLKEKGATYILSIKELREAVLPKVFPDERPLLIKIISDLLHNLVPHNNLTIIDPYLFPTAKTEQAINILKAILLPIVTELEYINFVTFPKHNHTTRELVEAFLKNANSRLVINYYYTEDYHDRIWIVDKDRGMFIGTSLNGIGNRYSLVDYVKEDDIKAIVSDLKQKGFL